MEKSKNNKFSKLIINFAIIIIALFLSTILTISNKNIKAEPINNEIITGDFVPCEDSYYEQYLYNKNTTREKTKNATANGASLSEYCLRDDYIFYTQNQSVNGLCWAYAGNMAVTTTLEKATGQYYDFSETWISLCATLKNGYGNGYVFASGGNDRIYNQVVKNCGLVLEADLQNQNSHIMCNQNTTEFYDYYSQFSNKNIYSNLKYITYKLKTQASDIKNHIYNNGALTISMDWKSEKINEKNYIKVPVSESDSGGHEIVIIGWDDDFSYTYQSRTYKGAWLCLNSWGNTRGNNGIYHILYEDQTLDSYVGGYIYNSSEADYSNTVSKGYTATLNYNSKTITTQQKNVFFNDNVNITYNYALGENVTLDNDCVKIYFGQEDVSSKFNIRIDSSTKEISLTAENVAVGPYKVEVNYVKDSGKDSFVNVFYVMDNLELELVTISFKKDPSGNYLNGIKNNGYYLLYNSYNYTNLSFTIAVDTYNTYVYTTYYCATYSSVVTDTNYTNINSLPNKNYCEIPVENSNSKTKNIEININYTDTPNTTVQTFFYYDLGGGELKNANRMLVNTTTGVTLPEPQKLGYVFDGWYYDKELTNAVVDNIFSYSKINNMNYTPSTYLEALKYYNKYYSNSSFAFVYAKWSLYVPTIPTLVLSINNTTQSTGKEFLINAKFNLPLENLTYSIDWYRNDSKISQGTEFSFSETLNKQGIYTFRATITFDSEGESKSITSNDLQIVVINVLQQKPNYSDGQFSWQNVEDILNYEVSIYYGEDKQVLKTFNTSENKISLKDNIQLNKAGVYCIGIKVNISIDGNTYQSEELVSEGIKFYKVNYVANTKNTINDKIVEENTIVTNPTSSELIKPGYEFQYWSIDNNKETKYDDTKLVTNDLTLYAKWGMKDIELSTLEDIGKTYDGSINKLQVNPYHESGLTNYTYKWYFQKDLNSAPQLLNEKSNSVEITNVSQSGIYYCELTLTDSDGLSVTNVTNKANVNISKYVTVINTSEVRTQYEYKGIEQTISGGAFAEDSNGNKLSNIQLTYEIKELEKRSSSTSANKFMNVPEDGFITLVIKTDGNENYGAAIVEVKININKAKPILTVPEEYQFFTYTGEPIMPKYSINNNEQTVSANIKPIMVSKNGYDIILTAKESKNYLTETINVNVTINPANVYVRVNDVTSMLFLGQKNLSYSIVSGVYNDDDLGISLSADIDTGKLGKYGISLTWTNENYKVVVFEGTYTVTALPYFAGLIIIFGLVYLVIVLLRKRKYQYDFKTNGGSILSPIFTDQKEKITIETPTKEGYKFEGWYEDSELTQPFNNKFKKSKGKTLYAKWVKIDGAMTLSEEMSTAQNIVNEIHAKINPPKETSKNAEEKPNIEIVNKEKAEEDKIKKLISEIQTTPTEKVSSEVIDLINKITDNKNKR